MVFNATFSNISFNVRLVFIINIVCNIDNCRNVELNIFYCSNISNGIGHKL